MAAGCAATTRASTGRRRASSAPSEPSTDGTWQFDYPFGSADSVETALFFASNFAHDFYYDLGFDEAAGNFQMDNFGRGGTGGDAVQTLARADGRNNATFEPAPGGPAPHHEPVPLRRRGLLEQTTSTATAAADLDGGYDRDIVLHEYHHGVTFRLNPSFTGVEADAMGEGGGDFFAYSVSGNTQLAEYSVPPLGIREVNEKTYADLSCLFFFYCEPHDNGEIWANVLWDLRERFRVRPRPGQRGLGHRRGAPALPRRAQAVSPLAHHARPARRHAAGRPPPEPGDGPGRKRELLPDLDGVRRPRARTRAPSTPRTRATTPWWPTTRSPPPARSPSGSPWRSPTRRPPRRGSIPGSFTVTRTGDTSPDLTVLYTVSGTATAGADYGALPGSVTIPAGSATATIAVAPDRRHRLRSRRRP